MTEENIELKRVITWKEGLFIATAVPVLVLPSIGFFASVIAGFSIIIWIANVIEGFFQCTAYAELATTYPWAPGIPGSCQEEWKSRSKFLAALGAWGYWFAWNPVLPINSLLAGWYMQSIWFPADPQMAIYLSLGFGALMYAFLLTTTYFGLLVGAYTQLAIMILSLVPLLGISALAYIMGLVHLDNITNWWLPEGWDWFSFDAWFIILGLMALAEWSSCAWECAATYSAEYTNPSSDVPKALIAAGGLCLFTYPFVQAACVGTLGQDITLDENITNPLTPLALGTLGDIGGPVAIMTMLAAMVLISNTALLGSSRAMYSLARNYHLPIQLAKLNKHGIPFRAAIVTATFDYILIIVAIAYGGAYPIWLLSASVVGYLFINGLTNLGFYFSRKDIPYESDQRTWKAPKFWVYIALFWGVVNLTLYQVGNVWVTGTVTAAALGYLVMLVLVPLYLYGQKQMKEAGLDHVDLKPIEL
ncbi:MAG: APC family permease [Methermicoccaceae archaeon]